VLQYTRLERLATCKHSSLLDWTVICEENGVLWIQSLAPKRQSQALCLKLLANLRTIFTPNFALHFCTFLASDNAPRSDVLLRYISKGQGKTQYKECTVKLDMEMSINQNISSISLITSVVEYVLQGWIKLVIRSVKQRNLQV